MNPIIYFDDLKTLLQRFSFVSLNSLFSFLSFTFLLHSKTIDAGSGYLCQMEPVAHYGIRKNEKDFRVEVKWTNGKINFINKIKLNQTITIKQK